MKNEELRVRNEELSLWGFIYFCFKAGKKRLTLRKLIDAQASLYK